MLDPICQTTKALNDTVIARLEGIQSLERVSEFYGIPFIGAYHKPSWRAALDAAAMGHRGTLGTLYSFVREATRSLDIHTTLTVVDDVTMTHPGVPDPSIVNQLIVIDDIPHYITNISGQDIALAPVSTGYWVGGNLLQRYSVGTLVRTEILAFQIHEPSPSKYVKNPTMSVEFSEYQWALDDACKVYLNFTGTAALSPATYLQPDGGLARPAGEPFGGHMQIDESSDGDPLDPEGPMPPYLFGGAAFVILLDRVQRLLAAGVIAFSKFKEPE